MRVLLYSIVVVNVSLAAINAALYASEHKPISLGAAVFCGFMALWSIVNAVRFDR